MYDFDSLSFTVIVKVLRYIEIDNRVMTLSTTRGKKWRADKTDGLCINRLKNQHRSFIMTPFLLCSFKFPKNENHLTLHASVLSLQFVFVAPEN